MSIHNEGLSTKMAEFLKDQSLRNDATGPGTAQLVLLRGCKVNSDGSLSDNGLATKYTDYYDDLLCVFGFKSGGESYLVKYKTSSKPGKYWIHSSQYSGSTRGCPTVQPGGYRYKRGYHRKHEAMVQAESPVVVIRDLDKDEVLEVTDLVDYPVSTGINIHAGGTSKRIGINSSGCQVIWGGWGGVPWQEFHHLIYSVAKQQSLFHYTVVDFLHFGKWHDDRDYKCLLFGSHGDKVVGIQNGLAKAGYFGSALVDGEFGRGTDRAVRGWQKSQGITINGILDPHQVEVLSS
jgi:hypothetical protein